MQRENMTDSQQEIFTDEDFDDNNMNIPMMAYYVRGDSILTWLLESHDVLLRIEKQLLQK